MVSLVSCLQKKTTTNKANSNDLINFSSDNINLDSVKYSLKLNSVQLLGSMTKNNSRVLLINGEINDKTYREQNLFIYPLGMISNIDSIKHSKFSLPGNQYNISDSLVYQSRIFYGDCTNKFPFSIIWYQKEKLENQKWLTSYFVLTPNNSSHLSYKLDENSIDLNEIISNLSIGKCSELPALDIHLEP